MHTATFEFQYTLKLTLVWSEGVHQLDQVMNSLEINHRPLWI